MADFFSYDNSNAWLFPLRCFLIVPQELDTTFTGFQWIDNERNNYD